MDLMLGLDIWKYFGYTAILVVLLFVSLTFLRDTTSALIDSIKSFMKTRKDYQNLLKAERNQKEMIPVYERLCKLPGNWRKAKVTKYETAILFEYKKNKFLVKFWILDSGYHTIDVYPEKNPWSAIYSWNGYMQQDNVIAGVMTDVNKVLNITEKEFAARASSGKMDPNVVSILDYLD